jgi:hypothetical protein
LIFIHAPRLLLVKLLLHAPLAQQESILAFSFKVKVGNEGDDKANLFF